MARRESPEINAGSMADIAFLLLIFFLVTTTMDVDSGIARKLPPYDEQQAPPPPVKKQNILQVLVNANDEILVNEDYMELRDLRQKAVDFIDNNYKGDCDYCQGARDKSMSENPEKHVISLQNDRGTSYEMYIAVQNELTAAYRELRNRESRLRFGRNYDLLSDDDAKEISKLYPLNISEAEPLKL
ncbi:MAG: biopolymer transporter ExbD [Cryomorphaceae bacterium]|nr:biopolymer transporter ExbD [Cryomorphaceae bacterium]